MSKQKNLELEEVQERSTSAGAIHRRRFVAFLGLGATAATVGMVACQKDATNTNSKAATDLLTNGQLKPTSGKCEGSINLGSGDVGILNFAYALEQLEAAFYTQVIANFYSGAGDNEKYYLSQIMAHEVAHREFFKTALGASGIPALTPDFSSIDFTSRTSVLNAAKAFEDTGVAAYDGAGRLIVNPSYLIVAGKIVSVEARHAAYIRELLVPNSFANNTVLDSNGLNYSKDPHQVIDIANTFLVTKICGQDLPTY